LGVGAARILVVEDEAPIRYTVADVLRCEGYEVDTDTNGAEALATMRITCPDAVLLDLMMPVMDGWAFLQHWRAEGFCGSTPILIVSASRQAAETTQGVGVAGCIAKPFDLDELLGAVECMLS